MFMGVGGNTKLRNMLNIMYKINTQFTKNLLLVITFFLIITKIYTSIWTLDIYYVDKSILNYMLGFALTGYIFMAFKSKDTFLIIDIVIVLCGLVLIFLDLSPSPIDETPNFDYINHIIKYHSLPSVYDLVDAEYLNTIKGWNIPFGTVNYEAVQAPIYYLVLAIIGQVSVSPTFRLILFRLIGLLLIILTIMITDFTVSKIFNRNIIEKKTHYRIWRIILFFTPGYVLRATRLNNEVLACFFMAIFIYVIFITLKNGYSKKRYIILALLTVILFLTKNTSIYAFLVFVIIALLQKKLFQAICGLILFTPAIIPWILMNFKTYGHITGMNAHLTFVLPIVNPNHYGVDIFDGILRFLPLTFFNGEELEFSIFVQALIIGCNIFLLILLVKSTVNTLRDVIHAEFTLNRLSEQTKINIVCLVFIYSILTILILGSLSTRIQTLRGRYIYPIIPVLLIFLLNNINELYINKTIIIFISLMLGFVLSTGVLCTINKIALNLSGIVNHELLSENEPNVELSSKVVKVKHNKYRDYSMLVDRRIEMNGDFALITAVDEDATYSYLRLDHDISSYQLENKVILKEKYTWENYNQGNNYVLGNIEGRTVCQEFVPKGSGNIIGFSVEFGTYNNNDYSADLLYKLIDENGKILATSSAEHVKIEDNSRRVLLFDKPVSVRSTDRLRFEITVENRLNEPIAISTSDSTYKNGDMYIISDSNEQNNKMHDIGFQILENYNFF